MAVTINVCFSDFGYDLVIIVPPEADGKVYFSWSLTLLYVEYFKTIQS